ncbi:Glycosyl hydrolases family 43 [Posidoniimonas polymericola]|uniref:Glycosyl hydrolases family 43 n=1 Tax=Posidoniimonas polymericola TaxID=2528002 RepID=A0A5C5ZES8_9BACT|nr:glycoside hydrolase family 43 protein [Posidoniimonas polymericola]TWT85351.1 Glycosyl hydrolases family 43 [Posidoniimonas polymericola]
MFAATRHADSPNQTRYRCGLAFVLMAAALAPGVAVAANGTGQVFAYFQGPWPTGGHSGVYMSYSSDGLNFQPMNNGDPVYVPPEAWGPGSSTNTIDEDQTRDPSVLYGPDGYFHMVWTSGISTRSIGYAKSADLKTWTDEQLIDIWSPSTVVDHTWAPELFYDAANSQYQIIFASNLNGGDHKLYSITTSDFSSFSTADPNNPYFYNGATIIDAMIAEDSANNRYLMAVKDEQNGAKNIRLATAPTAQGPWTTDNPVIVGPGSAIEGNVTEGPSLLKVDDTWLLYYDAYGAGYFGVAATSDADPANAASWVNLTGDANLPDGHHGTVFNAPNSVLSFDFLPYSRSDLNGDQDLTPDDWLLFLGNHLTTTSIGDLDADGDNDFDDFRLFKTDYETFHGSGAFASMLASVAAPEPSAALLALMGVPVVLGRRRGK